MADKVNYGEEKNNEGPTKRQEWFNRGERLRLWRSRSPAQTVNYIFTDVPRILPLQLKEENI